MLRRVLLSSILVVIGTKEISRLYVLCFTQMSLPRLSVSASFLVGSLIQVAASGVGNSMMNPPFLSWIRALILRDSPPISCRLISAFWIMSFISLHGVSPLSRG